VCTFATLSKTILGTFLKLHIWHYTHIGHKMCKFGCDRLVIYISLFEEPCASGLYIVLYWRDLYWTFLHRIPQSFVSVAVCLVSMVNNSMYCTWRAIYIFGSISGSIGGVSLKIHTWYFRRSLYKIIRFIDAVYVHRRVGLYVHPVGKGMVGPYIVRRADCEQLNRHTHGIMK
jgi:hypothetical protein